MSVEEKAAEFARDWYSRPGSGCDEKTLAILLTHWLEKERVIAAEEERARIEARLVALVTGRGR